MKNGGAKICFESVCRLCLNRGSLDSIFDHETIDIPHVVKFLTQLEILKDDGLTKSICPLCKDFIESLVEFRERCIQSYNTLTKLQDGSTAECSNETSKLSARDDFRLEFIECDSPEEEVFHESGDGDEDVAGSGNEAKSDADYQETDDQLEGEAEDQQEEGVDRRCVPRKRLPVPRREQQLTNAGTCPLCGEHFTGGKVMVKHHIKSDHGDDEALPKIRQCFFCPKAYSSYQLLKYHLNFHPQKVWQCPQCDKKFAKKGIFIDHLRVHSNERHYQCNVCGKRFTTIKYLSTHRQQHKRRATQEKIKHVDDPCRNDEFSPKDCIDTKHDGLLQCPICPEVFHLNSLLNLHLQCDHVPQDDSFEANFACAVCEKVYVSDYHLRTHMQLHNLDKHWHCDDCMHTFGSEKELNVHRRAHHQPDDSDRCFLCVYCGRSFSTTRYLNRHLQSHTKELSQKKSEIHECEICGKLMKNKSSYTNHRKSHKNNGKASALRPAANVTFADVEPKKVFLCNICGHNCGTSSNLAVHLRRHNGQSICQCSVCGKGFPRRSDLDIHMRKHTGEKPYDCPSCGKGFSRRDKLQIHIRTHTGEKPYECPCGRAYAQRNDLKTHQKRNICGQNFDLSKLLAPYPSSSCIKPTDRPHSPSREMRLLEPNEKDDVIQVDDPMTDLVKGQVTLLEVDMVDTTNWVNFMAATFPKHESATSADYDAAFSAPPNRFQID